MKSLPLLLLVLLLIAGNFACNRDAEQADFDSVLIDGFSAIIATNVDTFVEGRDIIGGEFDYIVLRGSPRLEQAGGRRTLLGDHQRPGSAAEWVYDGIDQSRRYAFDLGPLDLTADGRANCFVLDVVEFHPETRFTIRVFGTATDYMESPPLVVDTVGLLEVPFEVFEPVGMGARFDRVSQLTFEWELQPNSEVTLISLRTAPRHRP